MTASLRTLVVRLPLIALPVLASGCDVQVDEKGVSLDLVEGRASDEWTRVYALPPGGRLDVVNANGSIDAFPATGSDVEVRVRREVRARTDEAAQELLAKLTIRETVMPDHVTVESPDVREFGGFRQGVQLEYRVNLPPGLDVSLTTQNGVVRLENVSGVLRASSTNGAIMGRGVSGTVEASTVNGGIILELASVTGDSRITTVNGGIRLEVATGIDATIDANAVNGGVSIDERLAVQADDRSRQRITARLNGGGPRIEVRTTNGGIRISPSGAEAGGPGGPAPR